VHKRGSNVPIYHITERCCHVYTRRLHYEAANNLHVYTTHSPRVPIYRSLVARTKFRSINVSYDYWIFI